MSVSAPILNPSRMPRFTQALTLQAPSGARSAARISPRASALRNSLNRARSASLYRARSARASASMRSRSDMRGARHETEGSEHRAQAGARLLLHRDERQAELPVQQAPEGHGPLYVARVRLAEVRLPERQPARLHPTGEP